MTASIIFSHAPDATNETVVSPSYPASVPIAPSVRVLRNPTPQPPPPGFCAAVVESPASQNAGIFDECRSGSDHGVGMAVIMTGNSAIKYI